ncbi:PAS domain-containing protein [Flavivirga spongiicola]|uniref:PAS domain-containing protein n=1 Tax=Flavivirga spongiicola TaxID=421621 RepID=A0ABU7XZ73_9FLAO|nr:PAS domain-containing protein [Flavivirga sp. MEBiC05379]MDO5980848.1 PAS domain-containing protein [Flavivirga sp. MEBiC05379]
MKTKPHTLQGPLKCWDIYSMHLAEQAIKFTKQNDIEILKTYKNKFSWSFDVETILTNNQFEALVLTGLTQEIQWVNKGFTKMTGYSFKYAKGKKPHFLQGEKTSSKTLNNIRSYLKSGVHFKESIVNYRKNGEMYHCSIEVYPLKDGNNKITHLLALENEIRL